MRKVFLIAAMFLTITISAQEKDLNETRSYGIEISTGIPPISGLLASVPYSHDYFPEYDYLSEGIVSRDDHAQQLNIAFKWDRSHRWDIVLMGGITTYSYKNFKYQKFIKETKYEIPEDVMIGHWEGGPDYIGREFGLGNCYLSCIFRVKYAYMKHAHLYTAFGAGIDAATATNYIPLMPYISPIGISIGENSRIYGFTELTLGTGGSLILGGIGIRLFK